MNYYLVCSILLLGCIASCLSQYTQEEHLSRYRRGAAQTPAAAGGYNIGNKGSVYSVSSALGDYGRFTGDIGVHGAYGSVELGLGAALGSYGQYLNHAGGSGYGYPSTYNTGYGFGGTFYNKGK